MTIARLHGLQVSSAVPGVHSFACLGHPQINEAHSRRPRQLLEKHLEGSS